MYYTIYINLYAPSDKKDMKLLKLSSSFILLSIVVLVDKRYQSLTFGEMSADLCISH